MPDPHGRAYFHVIRLPSVRGSALLPSRGRAVFDEGIGVGVWDAQRYRTVFPEHHLVADPQVRRKLTIRT